MFKAYNNKILKIMYKKDTAHIFNMYNIYIYIYQ